MGPLSRLRLRRQVSANLSADTWCLTRHRPTNGYDQCHIRQCLQIGGESLQFDVERVRRLVCLRRVAAAADHSWNGWADEVLQWAGRGQRRLPRVRERSA